MAGLRGGSDAEPLWQGQRPQYIVGCDSPSLEVILGRHEQDEQRVSSRFKLGEAPHGRLLGDERDAIPLPPTSAARFGTSSHRTFGRPSAE